MPPARDSLAVSGSARQLPAGETIGGRFRIETLFSQDAIGQTYRALDIGHGVGAMLRVIPLRALGPTAAQLETEVERASALVHKNLVEVLSVGREADFFYLTTELLEGQTLREFIDGRKADGRNVSFKGACNLISHVANGLERAASFMPHGGLNPASIWVNKAGRVKVADLGLCRALPALAARGAPEGAPDHAYVAPEVLGGQPASLASDVYSLGVMLHEVLTGRLPAVPPGSVAQLSEDAPPALDAVLAKALARDPQARFRSVMELRDVLAAIQPGGEPAPGGRPAGPPAMAAAPVAAPAARAAAGLPVQPTADADGDGRRSTFGRSFNVAEAAGGAVDDAQERWLIQKDKLDFGPFSLTQIRAQIERGEIIGEHLIVDSDTGARHKVKDFPPLRDFSQHSERRLEQQRRANAEIRHVQVEKRKSVVTVASVLAGLLVVGGLVGYFVLTRKASDTGQLASREEAADIDAFLKDVKLNFASAHVAKRGSGAHHGTADAEFSNDANFGDASKYANAGDDVLDDAVVEETMRNHYRGLVPCLMAERHRSPSVSEMGVEFVIRGTGKVSAVKVNGQKNGPFASCVLGRMPTFPKFNGVKTIASWSMSMR